MARRRPADRQRPWTEKRGTRWRVRWPDGDGNTRSASRDDQGRPFYSEPDALRYGWEQMGQIARGSWVDPRKGDMTVTEWCNKWHAGLNVEPNTADGYAWNIDCHILPTFGERSLNSLAGAGPEINAWERDLVDDLGYARRTARQARNLLTTILGDAITTLGLDMANPAMRPRNRGRVTDRQQTREPDRPWATPLEAVLIGERAAMLAGRDDEFTRVVTLAWTGARWAELSGLERGHRKLSTILVKQQLYEHNGRWHVKPPKDGSYRTGTSGCCGPIDLPPFLADLLSRQAQAMANVECTCTADLPYCDGRQYLFLTGERGHHRRSNYARRCWRPAADGWYPPANRQPARPVLTDATQWPGAPVQPWPAATPGQEFTPPRGRGVVRHAGLPLASWLPVHKGLDPHGLRHGHKTWMLEDGIPEVLIEDRLGHRMPGIRGLYSHISPDMREQLVKALQDRWEQALRDRAALHPTSPVAILNEFLEPLRETSPRTSSRPATVVELRSTG